MILLADLIDRYSSDLNNATAINSCQAIIRLCRPCAAAETDTAASCCWKAKLASSGPGPHSWDHRSCPHCQHHEG